jgi:hypothetical protein
MIPDLGPAWAGEWGQRPEIPEDGHSGMDDGPTRNDRGIGTLKQAARYAPYKEPLLPPSVFVAGSQKDPSIGHSRKIHSCAGTPFLPSSGLGDF